MLEKNVLLTKGQFKTTISHLYLTYSQKED